MINGIPEGSSMDLPKTKIDEQSKTTEKQVAQFVQTSEWENIKIHFEKRIKHHQTYLPGNVPIDQVTPEVAGSKWQVADMLIKELEAVINTYEEIASGVQKSV